jgi:UPF0755 protein
MSEPQYTSRRALRKPKVNPLRLLAVLGVVALVIVSITYLNRSAVRSFYEQVTGAEYSGEGSASVDLIIERGDVGADVARKLVDADITKSYDITLRTIFSMNPTFFPGTYKLPSKISTAKAVEYLLNPNNAITNRITIREGLRNNSVFELLAVATGLSKESFVEASKDLKSFDIPKASPSLEGYLFPATYAFDPSYTAKEILQVLVVRTKDQLIAEGVAKADWHKVLTLASVIQREARQEQDFYKVSRVFKNRLKVNMPLQSDATVSYGVDGNTFQTSAADRADPNPYNTYKYPGLPIGPISGVGALAIDAALHPAEGNWLFFVSVNLKTGETVFSETYAQHQAAVRVWIQWLRENPGWND